VWDAHVVTTLALSPLIFDWASNALRATVLTPFVLKRRDRVARIWSASSCSRCGSLR
jgi:hypothetical protein